MPTLLRRKPDDRRTDPAALERGTRRPALIAVGLAIVLGCAGVGADLASSGARRVSYLEVSRMIPAGGVIHDDDLTAVALAAPAGVDLLPASDAPAVAGRAAVSTLPVGTLLVASDVSRRTPPPGGSALVGTSLGPSQMPTGLELGDPVLLVASGDGAGEEVSVGTDGADAPVNASSARQSSVIGRGRVFAVLGAPSVSAAAEDASSTVSVTVAVPPDIAAAVARASAAGDISLVELPLPVLGGQAAGSRDTKSSRGTR